MQMSTTYSSFDQYHISHKTISHQAAAARGPEVCRECPTTFFSALPLSSQQILATPLVATQGVYSQRMRSPIGRNAQYCATLFNVPWSLSVILQPLPKGSPG